MDYADKLKPLCNKGLFPFKLQLEGINWMMNHHYVILGDEMGSGKTIQAAAVMALSGGKSICVVPSSLKRNWKNEIEKFYKISATIIETGRDLASISFDNTDVIICSYALFQKLSRSILKEADTYVFDEAQYLCNIEAKRTQAVHEAVERYLPNRLLLLSGTPVKNRVGEYFSLLALCSYNNRGTNGIDISDEYDNFYKFQNKFSFREEYMVGRRKIVKFSGTRNIPELKELLKGKYKRRTVDKFVELPEMIEIPIEVDCSEGDEELYQDFLNGDGHISKGKAKDALLKVPKTVEYVNDLLQNVDAVIVFSDHVLSCTAISKGIKGSFLITGSTPTQARARAVERFQNGELDCIVATIGSMSTGHTLTRARDVVFNDFSWSEADNQQARARIKRIGQKFKTRAHYIMGSKMGKRIFKLLKEKRKLLRTVL